MDKLKRIVETALLWLLGLVVSVGEWIAGRRAAKDDQAGTLKRRRRRRRRVPQVDAQKLATLALAGVAVFSAVMIASILIRTVRTTLTNRELAKIREQATQELPPVVIEEVTAAPTLEPTAAPQRASEGSAAPEISAVPEASPAQQKAAALTPVPMGKRIYQQVGGDALPEMEALYEKNRDLVGWLRIENVLDLPVVYRNNEYYLDRDFYKQKNTAGTIFLDVNHPFKEHTQNLLLHGHNMKDGTMFGRLLQYETDSDYVRWHPFVRFDTLWRREEYVIFAVLNVSLDVASEDFVNYFTHPTFKSDAAFNAYIRELDRHSVYDSWVDVQPTDALLTLSTCLDENRLVIVARRVREGETHKELREITSRTTRK